MRTKYVIKNKKFNNYFKNKVIDEINHFVSEINEAKMFDSRKKANIVLERFRKQDNYEIVGYKYEQ